MRTQIKLLAMIALLGFVSSAHGQEELRPRPDYPVGFTVELLGNKVRAGDDLVLEVSAAIDPGWHVYATTMDPSIGPRPTVFEVSSPKGTAISEISSDPPPHFEVDAVFQKETVFFEDQVTWTLTLNIPAETASGKTTLDGIVKFQVCDANSCLPPTKVAYSLPIEVKGGMAPEAPTNVKVPPGKSQAIPPGRIDKAQFTVLVEPTNVKAGEPITVTVTSRIEPGWHVYSMDPIENGPRPTEIILEGVKGLKLQGDFEPDSPAISHFEQSFDAITHYFENEVTWTGKYVVPASSTNGAMTIKGTIKFQTCDANSCLRPTKVNFEQLIAVSGGAGTVNPSDTIPDSIPDSIVRSNGTEKLGAGEFRTETEASDFITTGLGIDQFEVLPEDKQIEGVGSAILFGFIAGMILNIMPCVLPVISLKIYGFVQQAGEDKATLRKLGLAFGAGILFVFLILALFASGLVSDKLGWGQQFQSKTFVVAMVALIVAFALGMFDLYTIQVPGMVGTLDAKAAKSEGVWGSFTKGMLATVLATPCSGPFLGATLSYALSQPPPIVFAIFVAIGLGMACPYVVLAWQPQWMKLLPRPGEWMNTFKAAMGFMLLGTALWLVWQRRSDGELVVWTVGFSLFVAFAMWLYGRWTTPMSSTAKRWAAPVVAIAIMSFGGYFSFGVMYEAPPKQGPTAIVFDENSQWKPFDLDRFVALRQQGKAVVVDWTADW